MKIRIFLVLSCLSVLIAYGWYRTLVIKADNLSIVNESIVSGNEYFEKGYYYEAAECYKTADKEEENGEYEEIIAYCYYNLEDEENCYIWADKAYENGQKTEFVYMIRAEKCLKAGEKKACCDILLEAGKNGIESELLEEMYRELKSGYINMYYSYRDVSEFYSDNAIVWEEDTCYIVDREGKKRTSGEATEIYDISTDDCIKNRWNDTEKIYSGYCDGLCRYYDESGYVRISPDDIYAYVGAPKDGMILVRKDKLWGYIDTDFNEISIKYEDATGFSNKRAAVREGGVWYIVDETLTPVNDEKYEEVITNDFKLCSAAGAIIVKKSGHYCLISLDGSMLLDNIEEAKGFIGNGGYAAVKFSGGWKLIDSEGHIVYEGDEEELNSTNSDLVGYREGEYWGFRYIDGSGLIEPCFEQVKAFNDKGYAFVMENGVWSMIQMEVFE